MNIADRKSLATPEVHSECIARIETLASDSPPLWGKMSSAQMMAHCAEILEVATGKKMTGSPWFIKLLRPFVRRMVVGPKPYPRSTRTHPQYLQVKEKDFAMERARLLKSMDGFAEMCAGKAVVRHPFFGELTVDEAGWAMFKHLDHHLRQFGS